MKHSLFIFISLFISVAVSAQQNTRYVGADNCKSCHNSAEKGAQYDSWQRSPHAHALRSLSSAKATEFASKNKIDNPSRDARCLKCHSTYDVASADSRGGIRQDEGVSCEACHGKGSAYRSEEIMKDRNLAMRNGLTWQNEMQCVLCHNPGSPFYKEFNYKVFIEKAKHTDPTRDRQNSTSLINQLQIATPVNNNQP